MKLSRKATLSPCRIHTPPRQIISRPSNVLTPCITVLKSLRIDPLHSPACRSGRRERRLQEARPANKRGEGVSGLVHFRHPELVSGSISPTALSRREARRMLKQVQHDGEEVRRTEGGQ